MSVPGFSRRLPSGVVWVGRVPTLVDLEAVRFGDDPKNEGLALVRRITRQYGDDRAPDPAAFPKRDTEVLEHAINGRIWLPGPEQIALINGMVTDLTSGLTRIKLHADSKHRPAMVVDVETPTAGLVARAQEATSSAFAADMRVLKQSIRAIDGKEVTYADLATSWPFDLPESTGLWLCIGRLMHASVADVEASEGTEQDVLLDE